MNILVAPRLLIKSAPQPKNALALAGAVQIRELCPNEILGPERAAAPKTLMNDTPEENAALFWIVYKAAESASAIFAAPFTLG